MQQQEFLRDRRNALVKSGSELNFTNALLNHAVVLVDVALPQQPTSYYIRQGGRLKKVQEKWIQTVHAALPRCQEAARERVLVTSSSSSSDDETRNNNNDLYETIENVICDSTESLMESLADGHPILWSEVVEPMERLHKHLSPEAKRNVTTMRGHWQTYLGELANMYQCRDADSYYVAARRSLAAAQLLGQSFDQCIFERPVRQHHHRYYSVYR